jgi:hypothetical protein
MPPGLPWPLSGSAWPSHSLRSSPRTNRIRAIPKVGGTLFPEKLEFAACTPAEAVAIAAPFTRIERFRFSRLVLLP